MAAAELQEQGEDRPIKVVRGSLDQPLGWTQPYLVKGIFGRICKACVVRTVGK